MRYLFYILLWVVPIQCFSQSLIDKAELKEAQMSTEPIVVEFWAAWNDANAVKWLPNLKECEVYRVDIGTHMDLQQEFEITSIPTVIIFNNGNVEETFNANIFAFWLLIARTSCYMKKSKYGRFLSLSSIGSKFGGGIDRYNYTSSKKLLEFFPKDLKDLARNNIFINNVICGVTDTPILRKKKNESINQRINLIPIGRLASPSEIAQCCFNTCSENNTFQTLSNITIAGGE